MERKNIVGNIIRIVVYFVIFIVAHLIKKFLIIHNIVFLIEMVAGVLFVTSLAIFLLSLLNPKKHRKATIVTLLISVLRYVAAIVIICWGLTIIGVNINTVVTSVSILALVVGFGAESLISDLVTGIFMIFENQYNVGDIVEINGFRGVVKSIGIRTTEIMDVGKNIKIVNNSDMKNILNRSDNASMAVSTIDIPYQTDLEDLENKLPTLLEDIYHKHEDVMINIPRYLGVSELGASGIQLKFVVEVDENNIFSVPRILNHDLLLGFRKLGIEVPFTQIDIHNK